MNVPSQGRLIRYRCDGPALNMAIDQLLLESVGATGRPTVRLYGWSEPTLSLGYFQRKEERKIHPASQPLAMVRRTTGGGAIVHHHELTYSVTFPLDASVVGAQEMLYQSVHGAMIRTLDDLAVRTTLFCQSHSHGQLKRPFLCFMRRSPNDIVLNGYKVLGSAQRKTRQAVLQHGSLLLQSSAWAPELPGLSDLTGESLAVNEIADLFSGHLQEALCIRFKPERLSDRERDRADQIAAERFASAKWNDRL